MAFSFEISKLFKLFSERLKFKKLDKGQSKRGSQWGDGFYGYRLKFWPIFG